MSIDPTGLSCEYRENINLYHVFCPSEVIEGEYPKGSSKGSTYAVPDSGVKKYIREDIEQRDLDRHNYHGAWKKVWDRDNKEDLTYKWVFQGMDTEVIKMWEIKKMSNKFGI